MTVEIWLTTRWFGRGTLSQAIGLGPALVPASPSIKAAAAEQKHDDDDDEKSCHIHDSVSFAGCLAKISPTSGQTWLLVSARAAPIISSTRPALHLGPADRVLNFSGGFFIPSLDLKLGVARGFADRFLHHAFGMLDGSLDAIFVHGR
jgi:hypothetical protein